MIEFKNAEIYSKYDMPLWLMLVFLFINNDTFFFAFNPSDFLESFPRYFGILLCVMLLIRLSKYRLGIKKKLILPYVVLSVFLWGSFFYNGSNFNKTMTAMVFITEGLLLAINFDFNSFIKRFNQAMYFLAVTSIIIWLLCVATPSIIRSFPLFAPNGARIYNLYVGGMFEHYFLQGSLFRSNSIFWEPGVFQIYLNIGLSYELLLKENVNIKRIIVYVLALFLTFSTASIVTTIMSILIYVVFKKGERTRKNGIIALLIIVILIGIAFVGSEVVYQQYFAKIIQKQHGSTGMRLGSLVIGAYLAIMNPIFGVGSRLSTLFPHYMIEFQFVSFANNYSFTNTLTAQFATYGIIFGTVFAIGTYRFSRNYSNNKLFQIAFFLLFVALYIDENLASSVLPWIIVFYGYSFDRPINQDTLLEKIR